MGENVLGLRPGDSVTRARLYLEAWAALVDRAWLEAPPARLLAARPGLALLKWTPLGERYVHHVYVSVANVGGGYAEATVEPPYPMYLAAAAAVLGSTVVAAVREGGRVVAILAQAPSLETVLKTLGELDVIDPVHLALGSWEGPLCATPAGYVALPVCPGEKTVDVIRGHLEEEYMDDSWSIVWPGKK